MHDARGVEESLDQVARSSELFGGALIHDQHDTVVLDRVARRLQNAHRIRYVVQHLERADEVEAAMVWFLEWLARIADFEADTIVHLRVCRVATGGRDRRFVGVDGEYAQRGERLRQRDRGPAFAASDFDGFGAVSVQSFDKTRDRRQPLGGQQVREGRTVEGGLEIVDLVRREGHASAVAKRLAQGIADAGNRGREAGDRPDEGQALLVEQRHRMLSGKDVAARLGVAIEGHVDDPRDGLLFEPFTGIARVDAGRLGQFDGGKWGSPQRGVQAEIAAEVGRDQLRAGNCGLDHAADERTDSFFVDGSVDTGDGHGALLGSLSRKAPDAIWHRQIARSELPVDAPLRSIRAERSGLDTVAQVAPERRRVAGDAIEGLLDTPGNGLAGAFGATAGAAYVSTETHRRTQLGAEEIARH